MKTCGIVTEYNPMHLGHAYQIKQGKEVTQAENTVLVMSGNFVQRGEPALVDKYTRTKAALESGIDLVIELPVYFSTASAEYFSHSAIRLLDALGVVTHLNFGSESGDIKHLHAIADVLYNEPIGYKVLLNDYLKEGLSFPKAREAALLKYNEHHNLLSKGALKIIETPNNILGIEYIKALKRLGSNIEATTIRRVGSEYHDSNSDVKIPSATAVRTHLKNNGSIDHLKNKLPEASYDGLRHSMENKTGPIFVDDMFMGLRYKLLTTDTDILKTYQDVTEGLENRMVAAAKHSYHYEELMDNLMTKRYTRTKIARALLHIYLGHTKERFENIFNHMEPYIRVLGFNTKGQQMLKEIKDHNETLPIIVNAKQGYKKLDPLQKECFQADLNATLLYNHLIYSQYGTVTKNDYQNQVIMI